VPRERLFGLHRGRKSQRRAAAGWAEDTNWVRRAVLPCAV